MNTFFLLLTSHILGDGIFTSSRLAKLKRSNRLFSQVIATGAHTGVHTIWAGLILFLTGRPWFYGAFMVFGLHFLIDLIRCRVDIRWFGAGRLYLTRSEFMVWLKVTKGDRARIDKDKRRSWFLINILDQGAHLGSLYVISKVV